MKYFYMNRKNPDGSYKRCGGLAIGYFRPQDGKLLLTFARCSENDVWNNEKARMICNGRLLKGRYKEIAAPEKGALYNTLIKEGEAYEQKVKETYGKRERVSP